MFIYLEDVDNALLQMHGLAKEDNSKEKVLKLEVCSRCKEENDPISDFCKKCGSALELETAVDVEEQRKSYDKGNVFLSVVFVDVGVHSSSFMLTKKQVVEQLIEIFRNFKFD